MQPTQELFRLWARCRDGTFAARGIPRLMQPIHQEIDNLLVRGSFSGNPRLIGMYWELVDHRDWFWTFLEIDCVEPTNNAEGHALRHTVISKNSRSVHKPLQSAASSRPR